ncbi:hypothetical protein B1B04_09975 [Lysinibacillus sp. KCTC 33748]|uniref:DUF4259 domain-containing protein n=1 Tax=unclassified Lysinibacillus TaxID=2636778 RepID=UPI0009A6FA69|nr:MULTISPECIES: DUF4259 domain-containing protein [unclassified Lysinibacillus]OXS74427.1 hypothetical protein B1B04_09975 [Lysinibacillus sp. KCTC 33748]SKB66422.1 protein of unknown function [Lysinibacillus sp. AC-3]
MGAWGYKPLESDEGLDVVDFLEDYIHSNLESNHLELSEVINAMKRKGFFGESFDDIDFLFDISAMALAELYVMYLDTGKLNDAEDKFEKIHSINADEESLKFILRYLTDIRAEVPDADGIREIVEIWRESECWIEWKSNLEFLFSRVEKEIVHSLK